MPKVEPDTYAISVQAYTDGKHGMISVGKENIILTPEQMIRFASQIHEIVNDLDMRAAQWVYACPGPLALIKAHHLMHKHNLDVKGKALCGTSASRYTDEWTIVPVIGEPAPTICRWCLAHYQACIDAQKGAPR